MDDVEDNNTRVLFERVLSSGSLPTEKSRLATLLLLLLACAVFSITPFIALTLLVGQCKLHLVCEKNSPVKFQKIAFWRSGVIKFDSEKL